MVKGSEALTYIGRQLDKDFTLDVAPRKEFYQKVFNSFIRGLDSREEKGTMLVGNIGVGKTRLMEVMQRAFIDTPSGFVWFDCTDIEGYLAAFKLDELKERYGKGCKKDILFDDLGTGNTLQNDYGNIRNVMSELIMDRYKLFIHEGYRTHITTNLPTDLPGEPDKLTLTKVLGNRIVDRIHEMCTIHVWKGKSLRRNVE